MSVKPMEYELSEHARESLRKRAVIQVIWLERTLAKPQLVEPNKIDPELEHRLLCIEEYEGRVLRVIVNKTRHPLRVITAHFDRAMRNRL